MQPEVVDAAPGTRWTPVAIAAMGVGAVLGSLGRGLPLIVADLLYRGEPLPECGDGGPVGCDLLEVIIRRRCGSSDVLAFGQAGH